MKNAKRTSWISYVNSINSNAPMSKIWKRIRKIRGSYQNIMSPCLVVDDELVGDRGRVADILASHYSSISSNNSYNERFQRIRQNEERKLLNFNSQEELPYNCTISLLEFDRMLSAAGKSSPTEDNISYNMIREVSPNM